MVRDGSLWPAARIRASIASRPSRWISVSVAPLSLTEIIQFANVCSVTGVSFGQFSVAAEEKLRCESGTTSDQWRLPAATSARSEEHTSELQSLMRIAYSVFCLKKNIPHTCK